MQDTPTEQKSAKLSKVTGGKTEKMDQKETMMQKKVCFGTLTVTPWFVVSGKKHQF